MSDFDQTALAAAESLTAAGFACHWLHPRTKRPIGNEWSSAPVASFEDLRRSHVPGNNVGVRLGERSLLTSGDYLHAFDLDIHVPELVDEARAALREIFPEVRIDTLPAVISGSGGESRHLYFVTDRPLFSKSLAHSDGKIRVFDKTKGRDVWKYEWSIDLFGTDKQVVLPPSIHPDTGQPYRWLREFDLRALALGAGPFIPSAQIEGIVEAVSSTYDFERREPLTFEPGQLERDLDDVPLDRIDDYHDWIALGQALHHQFGAGDDGFDLWIETSKRSAKFDQNDMRELRRKWRGFGRNRREPVTMGTVRQWAIEERHARHVAAIQGAFDEEPEGDDAPAAPPSLTPNLIDLLGDDDAPAAAVDTIDAIGTEAAAPLVAGDLDWTSLLDFNEEGALRPTLHNVGLIVRNDPRLIGVAQLNEFTQETVQRVTPGTKSARRRNAAKPTPQLEGRVWHVKDTLNGELWSDDRDFAIRAILEAPSTQGGYGCQITDRNLKAAVTLAANMNPFHPVREYLLGTTWDGTPRVDTLFIDYFNAIDDTYTRSVSRLMLVGAVTRIFEPGHKFDFAVILEGLQGKRKSTFIEILGRRWSAELEGDFHDPKQMIEMMQGAWILELPELTGFQRSDVRAIKAFISRKKDRARLAYARRAGEFPRQCIFLGSTNDREYLKDDTGGRRFWPMPCNVEEIDTDRLEREVDQIWAEAVVIYQQMRREQPHGTLPLYLRDEGARITAARLQEARRIESADDALAGQISAWLDKPINTGGLDDEEDGKVRNETCLIEIWCECMAGDRRGYTQQVAQTIGRAVKLVQGWSTDGSFYKHKAFGKQRVYRRGGNVGMIERAGGEFDLLG